MLQNRQMKDSGIAWVSEIPQDWQCMQIRALFTENRQKNVFGKETKALQFNYGTIVPKKDFDVEEEYVAKTVLNYNIVDYGMIMLNGLNLNFDFVTKRVALVKERGVITSAYMSFYANDINIVMPEYAYYLFRSYDDCAAFYNMGGGVRKILNFNELKRQYFVLPSLAEQQRIADYLDVECEKIDNLKTDIQTQIDTLEQYKRSVITEAVTHGLNPDAPMKDSGIAWVGSVPQDWQVMPLYCIYSERKNINIFGLESNLLSLSYGKIIRKDINSNGGLLPSNYNGYNIVEKNDIVIRPTDLQNDKRSLRTGIVRERGIITSAYIALKPNYGVNSKYYHYLLHSYDIKKVFYNMGNGVRQGLNYDEFAKVKILVPPNSEQQAIVDYLDNKCDEIENVIADKKSQLEILDEYKKSLIYEFVTGKKEVV